MKALKIDYNYYQYPNGFETLASFMEYLNRNYHQFLPLVHLIDEKCCEPYFVQEDTELIYLNVSQMDSVSEVEITVLPRKEYDARLREVVAKKCVDCVHYDDETDDDKDDLKNHRDRLSLDGECAFYQKEEL